MPISRCFYILFCLAWLALEALPPPVPSGGVIERQIQKEYETSPLAPEKKTPEIQIDIPEKRLEMPADSKVYVCKIELRGNEALSSKKLCKRLDSKINCPLTIADIYKLCEMIETYYAEEGFFLTRAYPPPQKIEKGVLVLEILEGKLGNIKVVGNRSYRTSFILGYFESLKGKALNYNRFLRSLILLNENSDLSAGAIFEKGSELGKADLLIRVVDKYPIHLYLNGNNYGRWLTTNFRAGGRLDTRFLMNGDKLSIAEVVGFPLDALYFTDIVYHVPINYFGTSFDIAYLTSRFHVEELTSLRLAGRSDIATFKLSQALRRGRSLSTDVFSSFDYKQIKNFIRSHIISFDKIRLLTIGSIIDYYSEAAGRNYLVLKMGLGLKGFLGGLSDPSPMSSRPGAEGYFLKLNGDYDCMKRLPHDIYFVFHASGQWSADKLTLPEQIYIGGADTIRGFPLASAMGDSGYYCNLEMRIPPFMFGDSRCFKTSKTWKEVLQLSAFFDQGGVFYKGGSHMYECGTGLGIRVNAFWSLALTAEVGFPLNHRDLSTDAFFYLKVTGQPF